MSKLADFFKSLSGSLVDEEIEMDHSTAKKTAKPAKTENLSIPQMQGGSGERKRATPRGEKNEAHIPKFGGSYLPIAPSKWDSGTFSRVQKKEEVELTIFFVEDSVETERAKVEKIVTKLSEETNYVKIITYGSFVNESIVAEKNSSAEIFINSVFDESDSNACLYDALVILKNAVFECNGKVVEDTEETRKTISSIKVIGIGTARNVESKESKSSAVTAFNEILKSKNVSTRYICYKEEETIGAAAIGFREISFINNKF